MRITRKTKVSQGFLLWSWPFWYKLLTDKAYAKICELGIHIPNSIERDARSKWAIRTTTTRNLTCIAQNPITHKSCLNQASIESLTVKFKRRVRVFQCLCGTDNTTGRLASKTRQIAWTDVECTGYATITTTIRTDSKYISSTCYSVDLKLAVAQETIAVNSIHGILSHTDRCEQERTTSRDPRINLHPSIRDFALNELRSGLPLHLLQIKCRAEAVRLWGESFGDSTYRYRLEPYDSSSLYRTRAREIGIKQRTSAESNLHTWFRSMMLVLQILASLVPACSIMLPPLLKMILVFLADLRSSSRLLSNEKLLGCMVTNDNCLWMGHSVFLLHVFLFSFSWSSMSTTMAFLLPTLSSLHAMMLKQLMQATILGFWLSFLGTIRLGWEETQYLRNSTF